MFVEHVRRDFYDKLVGQRVLIMANHDVDSVCACKILQRLFQMDSISYTLVGVEGLADLQLHFNDYRAQAKVAVFINCGGTVDLLDALNYPKDITFFVMDSHRPTHVLNIYNDSNQVRLVMAAQEDENIPAFDDIFRDDIENEEDEDEDDFEENAGNNMDEESTPVSGTKRKRGRLDPESIQKRKEVTEWLERRRKILFDYTNYTYYGAPASLYMLEVAWKLTRADSEVVWWSIVGLTDYYIMNRMTRTSYLILITQLQDHVARLMHSQTLPRDCLKISFENELTLLLYRHWTLYESFKMTQYSACKFKTWSLKGEKKFHEFLADLGLPLVQCRQKYSSMDLSLRKSLKEIVSSQRVQEKYKFDEITIGSFTAQYGFRNKYSAIDAQMAVLALLESPDFDMTPPDKFLAALNSLSKTKVECLEKGLDNSKFLLKAIYQQVQIFMDMKQVVCLGPFLYVLVPHGCAITKFFGKPNSLILLAQYTLHAAIATTRNKNWSQLPLIIMSPMTERAHLLVGIPPISCEAAHNLFGKVFEQTAAMMPDTVALDVFDSSVVHIISEHKGMFLNNLLSILA